MHTLFVYGTLKRSSRHPMARLLAQRAVYLGPATLPARLYDLGRYPGITPPTEAGDRVQGDLYDLDADLLREMDEYENLESPLPAYFDRQQATVQSDHGPREAWVYWYRGPVEESRRIASGIYEANGEEA